MPPIQSAEHPPAEMRMAPRDLVELIMTKAFSTPREPRSAPYKDGMRALLSQRTGLGTMTCQFHAGTAEYDAFFSGADEGRSAWMEYQLLNERTAPAPTPAAQLA